MQSQQEAHGADASGANAAGTADLEGRLGRDASDLGGALGFNCRHLRRHLVVHVGEAQGAGKVLTAELRRALMRRSPEADIAGDLFALAREPALSMTCSDVTPEVEDCSAVALGEKPCGEAEAAVEAYDHARRLAGEGDEPVDQLFACATCFERNF